MIANDFLSVHLNWKPNKDTRFYYCYFNDVLLLLRMNNFPDEPLYTFIYLLDIIDIEDLPSNWEIEH
jgi:hypothetical protein